MNSVKRITGMPFQFGGEEHTGWLPPNAAVPLPTPFNDALLDVEIQYDGHGFLLCYATQDGLASGDTWYESLADAEQAAKEQFGIQRSQWQTI